MLEFNQRIGAGLQEAPPRLAGTLTWLLLFTLLAANPVQAAEVSIFDNGNIQGVLNGPTTPTVFSITSPALINSVLTYHWNGGQGSPLGTLALKHSDGTTYGPWTTTGVPDTRYWVAYPKAIIKAGSYTVIDSTPSTWSYNSASGNAGIAVVKGEYVTGGSTLAAPQGFAYALNDNQLTLNWQAVSGATGYALLLGTQPGVYPINLPLPVSPSSLGPLDLAAVAPGTYYLALKATAGSASSPASSELAIAWNGPSDVPSGFQAGTAQTYALTGGRAIVETLSGAQFVPPVAANGTLSVKPITASPWQPPGGTAVLVSASGADYVDIQVPHSPGSEMHLRVWGPRRSEGKTKAGTMSWSYELPYQDDGTTATFRLPLDSASATRKTRASKEAAGIAVIVPSKVAWDLAYAQSAQNNQRASLKQSIEDIMTDLLNRLPANQRAVIQQRRIAMPAPIIAGLTGIDCDDEEGSAYAPYFATKTGYLLGVLGISTRGGYIEFCGLNNPTVAYHEIGHYLHHLIAGDATYKTILGNSLNAGAKHVLGQVFDRRSLIEDYAYLFEMIGGRGGLLTSAEAGSGFGAAPFNKTNIDYTQVPRANRDYPAMEGFFASFLGAIAYAPPQGGSQRSVTLPDTLDGASSNVQDIIPVIGVGWGPILDFVVTPGISSTDALRDLISPLGASFAVIGERYGWSYFGHGKVVDSTGQGVGGVSIQSTCRTDSGNYVTPATTTAADGSFRLNRIFPGEACVLVVTDTDGKADDWKVVVDAKKPTSTDVDLGSYTLTTPPKPSVKLSIDIDGTGLSYWHNWVSSSDPTGKAGFAGPNGCKGTAQLVGDSASGTASVAFSSTGSGTFSVTLSPDRSKIVSATCTYTDKTAEGKAISASYTLTDIPFKEIYSLSNELNLQVRRYVFNTGVAADKCAHIAAWRYDAPSPYPGYSVKTQRCVRLPNDGFSGPTAFGIALEIKVTLPIK